MAVLVIQTGPLAGRRLDIQRELVIGRGEADVVIDDRELSRRHVALRPGAGGVEVEDLGSLNGTWVGDERIEGPQLLADGALIRIGVTILAVEPAAAAQPPAVEPAAAAAAFAATGSPGEPRPRRGPVTRLWLPTAVTVGVIVATAIALVIYFALR
ncbi:MAG TPA: FHA domain-containing protein [Solirubrobacteraceae bacterium]|nr:FHA domain-containing protein [Solirubrobacteraceae bacterium]